MNSEIFDLNSIRRTLDEIEPSYQSKLKQLTTNVTKPTFKPKYLGKNKKNNAINAIIEIRALWGYTILDAAYIYPKVYAQITKLSNTLISGDVKKALRKHTQAFAVYDKLLKKWLVETDEPKYKYCYDGEDFIEFFEAKKVKTGNRLLLVGKYTILAQEVNLLEATVTAPSKFETFVLPNNDLTVGVPGCGKTTYIIKNHRKGSLVLTSCAEGAKDIRFRMADKRGGDAADYKDSYRTIDSYLMNSRKQYASVWVDEALMEHPGKLFLVCIFTGCRNLHLLGDPNHLGYINRMNEITLQYFKSSMFFTPTKTLNVSYRCPVDVISLISKKYEGGASSASKVLRSLEIKAFTTLKRVPNYDNVKYLVFKQAEKKRMEKAKYNVSTIHEFQGKEADHVILVRMSQNLQEPLYDSAAHILVGISRHKQSFVYYTPVADTLKQLISK